MKRFIFLFAVTLIFCACGERQPPKDVGGKTSSTPTDQKVRHIRAYATPAGTVSVAVVNNDLDGGGCWKKYDPSQIMEIGIGSNNQGWDKSSTYPRTSYNPAVTETVIDGLKPDQVGVRFTPFLRLRNSVDPSYFDLVNTKWLVNGSNYVVPDNNGLTFEVPNSALQIVVNPPPATTTAQPTVPTQAIAKIERMGDSNKGIIHIPTQYLTDAVKMKLGVASASISRVFMGSDAGGWGQSSAYWTPYNAAVTDTVINSIPLSNGRMVGNFGIFTSDGTVVYANLDNGSWETDPRGGIVPDKQGGHIIDIKIAP